MENKLAKEVIGAEYKKQYKHMSVNWRKVCTGKTTGHALELISKALLSPEVVVELCDPSSYNSQTSKYFFSKYVEELINKLGLRFMKVNLVNFTLVYEPFEYEETIEDKIRKIVKQELGKE